MTTRAAIRPLSLFRSVRRFAIPIVFTGILGAVASLAFLSFVLPEASVEARALVVARESTFPLDELPAALDAVSKTGIVEAGAVEADDLAVSSDELAAHSSIVVVRGTPIIQVTGSDESASNAVLYANSVADSLVDVLNRSGTIGVFELIEPSIVERTELSPRLSLWPPAVLIGLISGVAALLVAFVVTDPIHTVGDLASATEAEVIEEVWLDPRPPIAGKVRSAANRLIQLGGTYRLIHAGWGEDMTLPLEDLLQKFEPVPYPAAEDGEPQLRDVIVVMEGTPIRTVLDIQGSLPTLPAALILIHPRLAT